MLSTRDPAERVLSGLLACGVGLIDEVSRSITESHFTDPTLKSLYRAILVYRTVAGGALSADGVAGLTSGADAGTAALVREVYDALVARPETMDGTRWAAEELRAERERWLTLAALRDAQEIASGSVTEEPDARGNPGRTWAGPSDARQWVSERVSEIAAEVAVSDAPAADVFGEARDILSDYVTARDEDKSRRPMFGIPALDDITGGLGRGELVMVAASSGFGKSQMCVSLAYNAAVEQNLHVYFATSETVRKTVRARLVARHSRNAKFAELRESFSCPKGLNSKEIDRGKIPPEQVQFLGVVAADFDRMRQDPDAGSLWVAQMPYGQTMPGLAAAAEARARAARPDLLIVDYLALMSGTRRFQSKREELSSIVIDAAHLVVDFARGEGIPMVSPWQLNRESQKDMVRTGELDSSGLAETAEAVNSQPLHSKVLTPTGFRRMGDLRVGDPVIDPEGQPSVVTAVQPKGRRMTYRVTFADGGVAESSLDHLWKVRGKRNNRAPDGEGWRVLRLGDFAPGVERLPAHRGIPNPPRGSESVRRVVPTMAAPDLDGGGRRLLDPYLLGLLLGDGSFASERGSLSFCSCDPELLVALKEALPEGAQLSSVAERFADHEEWSLNVTCRISGSDGRRPGGNPVIVALRSYGLWGMGSALKFVPGDYKLAPAEVRQSVLQGLMDTDGSTGVCSGQGRDNVFTSTSMQLRDDVVWLARSLGCKVSGIRTVMNVQYTISNGSAVIAHDAYMCRIIPPDSVSLFRLERKAASQRQYRLGRPVRAIVGVEPIGEHEHQCIQVSAVSHLYVTDDFTVTHNSADLVLALSPDGERTEREAPLKLSVLKNREGEVLIGSNGIPMLVDYATSFFESRVGADAAGDPFDVSTNGGLDEGFAASLGSSFG